MLSRNRRCDRLQKPIQITLKRRNRNFFRFRRILEATSQVLNWFIIGNIALCSTKLIGPVSPARFHIITKPILASSPPRWLQSRPQHFYLVANNS